MGNKHKYLEGSLTTFHLAKQQKSLPRAYDFLNPGAFDQVYRVLFVAVVVAAFFFKTRIFIYSSNGFASNCGDSPALATMPS